MKLRTLAALGLLVALPVAAMAQGMGMGGMGMGMGPMAPAGAQTPATQALMAAHQSMMGNMHVQMTGNPDKDFILMMIPHHQGAIDMARAELEHGTDAAIKAMAQKMIDAQEAEIAEMQAWLAANP